MTDQTGRYRPLTAVLTGAVLATITATQAGALSIVLACGYDPATGRLIDADAPAPDNALYVEPYSVGDGFAAWEVEGDRVVRAVLQHCPSGQELTVTFPRATGAAAFERYRDMLLGDAPYTMRQIGDELAPMGARARLTENEFGNCACEQIYGSE